MTSTINKVLNKRTTKPDISDVTILDNLERGEIGINMSSGHTRLYTKRTDNTLAEFYDNIYINEIGEAKEDKSNKVSGITSASTDIQYSSARAVYEAMPFEYNDGGIRQKCEDDASAPTAEHSSFALGLATVASGAFSFAGGDAACSTGEYSFAFGSEVEANGDYSHAEGGGSNAEGDFSHAEGQDTHANGDSSHAEGYMVTVENTGEHGEGVMNLSHNGADTSAQTIHSVGIGYQDEVSGDEIYRNAEEIMLNGDKYLYGVGGYDGTNPESSKSLQQVIDEIQAGSELFESGSGQNSVQRKNINANASGKESIALGHNTTASGSYSTAVGYGTISSGSCTYAEGYNTKSTKSHSHAEGENTQATMDNAHAEGYGTLASGLSAHAEGNNTEASGQNSHAEGQGTVASGAWSHSEGNGTQATNRFTHAEGHNTQAIGVSSHAEGDETYAEFSYSHAEGHLTHARNDAAHAEGESSVAAGAYSHAEGYFTYADAEASHSEGNNTIANGTYSHAEGYRTTTQNEAEHAEGKFNVSHTGTTDADKTIHSVGIGVLGAQKNAEETMLNGDKYIFNIGGYNGTNPASAQTIQEVIESMKSIITEDEYDNFVTRGYITDDGDGEYLVVSNIKYLSQSQIQRLQRTMFIENRDREKSSLARIGIINAQIAEYIQDIISRGVDGWSSTGAWQNFTQGLYFGAAGYDDRDIYFLNGYVLALGTDGDGHYALFEILVER